MNPDIVNPITETFLFGESLEVTLVGAIITLAIQYLLVMVWVASPFGGELRLDDLRTNPGLLFIVTVLLLGINGLLIGLSAYARIEIAEDSLSNLAMNLSFVLFAILGAFLAAGAISWVSVKEESNLEEEIRTLNNANASADFSFQAKRRERLQKRAKRR